MRSSTSLKLAILFFIGFFLVAVNLNNATVLVNDFMVSNFVVNHQNSVLNQLCSVISVIFEPIYVVFIVLILSVILWAKRFRKEAFFLAFISACAGASIFLLKHFFVRVRPVTQFLQETGYSFPSGHALISIILFGSLIYFSLRMKSFGGKVSLVFLSILGILVLGLSRIYLNVHWISDVIGGYLLGATILFIGIAILKSNTFQRLIVQFHPK